MSSEACELCHVPDDHPVIDSMAALFDLTRAEAYERSQAVCTAICSRCSPDRMKVWIVCPECEGLGLQPRFNDRVCPKCFGKCEVLEEDK